MAEINENLCMSIKSKNENIQCPHLKKEGSEYCGRHMRAKHLVRIDTVIGILPQPKKIIIKSSKKDDNSIYYLCNLKKIKSIIPDKIKRSCLKYGIDFDENNIETTFNNLKDFIYKTVEPFSKYEKQIIQIQKTFRMWNVFRRNKSNNKEDCGTLDSIYDIPIEYYIDYQDDDGFIYAFDIRTLELINKNDEYVNPYTQKHFTKNNNFLTKFKTKMNCIKENNTKLKYDSPKLTEEQRYHQFLIRVFQKFDMLGQYTDIAWFDNMDLQDLKRFYKNCYDMFEYRAQLSHEIKRKIVKDGIFFNTFNYTLNAFKNKNKRLLQFEILREMERIVDEGDDKEYKTLGANLILTVLVEICPAAANALPHLVQSSFN